MPTLHVLVETNWVVDLVAPLIAKSPEAGDLLERSRRGEIALHVPAISLSEAQKVVRERMPRTDLLGHVRAFVRDKRERGDLAPGAAQATFELLSQFQQHVDREKEEAPKRLVGLLQERALDVFHLDEEMLVRSTQLAAETSLKLESFDNAILAAVLARGAALRDAGHEVCFCTTDAHLQPWDKYGNRKNELGDLVDDAGVWVYGDFLLERPPRPPAGSTR